MTALFAAGAAADGPDPAAAPDAFAFVPVSGDPDGAAERADREAVALLRPSEDTSAGGPARAHDPVAAAERWMDLSERDPSALLADPSVHGAASGRSGAAPLLPAREVALLRLAGLPEAGRQAVEARFGALARAALAEAEATASDAPLARAASRWPVTVAGGEALLLLSDRDLERGRYPEAASGYERRLRLHPFDPRRSRASVALRWVDALAFLGDAQGIANALARCEDLLDIPVRRGDGQTTLRDRGAAARAEIGARRATRRVALGPLPVPPPSSAVLWSRSLVDGSLLSGSPAADVGVAAGVAAEGDAVYLAEERTVRRLDRSTGRVRWTYPAAPLPRDVSMAARFAPRRLPVRRVAVADGIVLAVLGDAAAAGSSSFWWRDRWLSPSDLGREMRARLVALDASSGALRWIAGAPRASDDVLAREDVSVASPPTVQGDRVYVLLSSARAETTSWLASLDLETGAPRFVTPLAGGLSGLDPPPDPETRNLKESRLRAVPPGQAPSVAGGTVCVVTGAGYAALVGADDGRVRWIAPLPAFPPTYEEDEDGRRRPKEPPSPEACASLSNRPVLVGGAWVVAASDSPVVCALDAATGRLRWALPPPPPGGAPPWPLLLAGPEPSSLHLATRTGSLAVLDPDTGDVGPAESPPDGAPGRDASALVHSGDLWFEVTPTSLVALADPAAATRAAAGTPAGPADAAMRLVLAARLDPSLSRLSSASLAVSRAPEPSTEEALFDALDAALARLSPSTSSSDRETSLALVPLLDPLPSSRRGALLARIAEPVSRLGPHEALVGLIERAFAFDDPPLVDAGTGLEVRLDLLAATRWWAAAASSEAGRAALARLESAAEREVADAAAKGDEALAVAVGRARGSPAAWEGRMLLLARHVDAERWAEAAAVLSDLRLWPDAGGPSPLPYAASLRAAEAEALSLAGERAAACAALFDVTTAVGRGVPALGHDRAGPLFDAWKADADRVPEPAARATLGFPDSAAGSPPSTRAAAVTLLEPSGPGATSDLDTALFVRGGDVVGVSLATLSTLWTAEDPVAFEGIRVLDREPSLPPPGVLVAAVTPGSACDVAGIRAGDWVERWGGSPLSDASDFLSRVARVRPGQGIDLTLVRGGVERVVRVVGGVRPAERPAPMRARSAWFDGRGSAVVPRRGGLHRIDLATGLAEPLSGAGAGGDWIGAALFAGRAFLVARGGPARVRTLSCVDVESGSERWRVALEGDLPEGREPWVLGSAVVVDLEDPARTWLLDRETGRPRLSVPRYEPVLFATTAGRPLPMAPSVAASGLLFVLGQGEVGGTPPLLAIDPATGEEAWRRDLGPAPGTRLYPPLLAGGSLVAAAVSVDEMPLFLPDLRVGVAPSRPVVLDALRWDDKGRLGPLDVDSRIEVHGDTVLLLRCSANGVLSACAFELDRERLGKADRKDPVLFHPPRTLLPAPLESGVRAEPRLLSLKADLFGAWIGASFSAQASGPTVEGRLSWFDLSPEDGFANIPAPATFDQDPPPAFLLGPVRVGTRMLCPVDEGFVVVPLVPRPR